MVLVLAPAPAEVGPLYVVAMLPSASSRSLVDPQCIRLRAGPALRVHAQDVAREDSVLRPTRTYLPPPAAWPWTRKRPPSSHVGRAGAFCVSGVLVVLR